MAAAAALLVVLLAVPGEAKADGVLVSNTGRSADASASVLPDRAQRFTTGSNTGGYTLSSVDVVSGDAEGDDFTVDVYTVDANGFPDTLHASLTSPGSFAAGTLNFTAPSGTMLAADTTYTLLVSVIDGGTVTLDSTPSDAEDSRGAAGWSIADAHDFKNAPDEWKTTGSDSLRIAVNGNSVGGAATAQAITPLDQSHVKSIFPATTGPYKLGDNIQLQVNFSHTIKKLSQKVDELMGRGIRHGLG